MERIKLSNAAALQVVSYAGSGVENLSEEDFDKEFDKMMEMTPQEFDAKQDEPTEETLSESPVVPDEPEATDVTDTDVGDKEVTNEQPEEELSTPEEEEPVATGEPEASEESGSETQDSPTEPTEYDFSAIPRDKIMPFDISVNGMKVRATMEELEAGFKKGMNYTQKMQEIAPHRQDMNLMAEHGLNTADLNLLIEAKKGNKDALGKLIANAKVDTMEIDAEASQDYTPENYAKPVANVEMEQVKSEILADTEVAPSVENALQTMPEDMYEMVSSNAMGMNSLYSDMKSGMYEKVMPEVLKQQALYGVREPTIQTYLSVAKQYFGGEGEQQEQPAAQPEPTVNNAELNNKRRNAGTTPPATKTKPESFIQKDLDSMSDDDFEKEFQKMVGRSTNDFE